MGVEYRHYLIPEDNTYKPNPGELSRLVNALFDDGFVTRGNMDAIRVMEIDPDPPVCEADTVWCFARLPNNKHLWFPCPCSARDIATLEEQDFQLVWSVGNLNEAGLRYPLSTVPDFEDVYYDLELHMATDFVYHTSELIDPFHEVVCPCDQLLPYSEWDGAFGAKPSEADDSLGSDIDRLSGAPPGPPLYCDCRIHRLCPSCGRPFRPQELIGRVRDGKTGEVRERAGGATYRIAIVIDCGKGWPRRGWPLRVTDAFMETVTQALGQTFYEIGDVY